MLIAYISITHTGFILFWLQNLLQQKFDLTKIATSKNPDQIIVVPARSQLTG